MTVATIAPPYLDHADLDHADLDPASEEVTASAGAGLSSFAVTAQQAGARLDRFLADALPAMSRSRLQALIKAGAVSSAGATVVEAGFRVKPGDLIEIVVPAPVAAKPVGEAIPLVVVHEDEHLIVIDKPAGLVVHPSAGHDGGTLVNALIAHCGTSLSGIGGVRRPGIVHRLDKETSGLLVVAKTDAAHHGLAEQFANHGADGRMTRRYRAIVWGALPHVRGRIDAPLMRSETNRTRITVARSQAGPDGSRHAVTHFHRLREYTAPDGKPVASLVECTLETGRTHQIRVHMAHIGHPLLGDRVYGSHFAASSRRLAPEAAAALETLGRQALHAAHLGFEHPVTGRALAFDSPLPTAMQALLDALAR